MLNDFSHRPGGVIYIEDSDDWRRTYAIKPVLKSTSNRTVYEFDRVDSAFLSLLRPGIELDNFFADNQALLNLLYEIERGFSSGVALEEMYSIMTPDNILHDMMILSSYIDPEKIKERVFISDNETPGMMYGSILLEAISIAALQLEHFERPKIIALMASNISHTYEQNELRKVYWDKVGIEAIHKNDYAIALFWIAHRLGPHENISFYEFFQEFTGYAYESRVLNHRKLNGVRDFCLSYTDYFSLGNLPGSQVGLFSRLNMEDLKSLRSGSNEWQSIETIEENLERFAKLYPENLEGELNLS